MINTSNRSNRKIGKKNIRSFLKSITPGEQVWLRDGVLKQIQTREWIFSRVEKDGTILIVLKGGDFGLDVKADDIDWEAYRKSNEHGGHPFWQYVDR
ncbi:MAG: hypothetical protein ABSG71_03175 [Thermodesulfobacteriota bacterium]|jgi:hypothetical protein